MAQSLMFIPQALTQVSRVQCGANWGDMSTENNDGLPRRVENQGN